MRDSEAPRARAVVAKGDAAASARPSRMTWPRKPAVGIARVTTGSTRPAGAAPTLVAGNQPRLEEKTRMSTAPSQKCGTTVATTSPAWIVAATARPASP